MVGGHIVADCHYSTANQKLKEIGAQNALKFYTPFPKPEGNKAKRRRKTSPPDPTAQSEGISVLSKKKLEHNAKVSDLRARVEGPFGVIKEKWECLGTAFMEDIEQHNCVVNLACASYNYLLKHH